MLVREISTNFDPFFDPIRTSMHRNKFKNIFVSHLSSYLPPNHWVKSLSSPRGKREWKKRKQFEHVQGNRIAHEFQEPETFSSLMRFRTEALVASMGDKE